MRGRRATARRRACALLLGMLLTARFATAQTADIAGAQTADGAPADWPEHVHDSPLHGMLLVDQLEFGWSEHDDFGAWEAEGWLGGDVYRLVLQSEGHHRAQGPSGGEAEFQLLARRAILPFWNVQLGVRQDVLYGSGTDRERTLAAIGVEGLAPQWFELEPALFVSDEGDVSARLEATYELFVTQRLVAQPRLELDVAASDVREFEVESGFTGIELGLRLRYEFRRELAPYLGVSWHRRLADTAELARDQGRPVDDVALLVGLRFWL